MKTTKYILTLLLMLGLLFAQVGSAAAAPSHETTPISGTVTLVECQTDTQGVNTFTVTLDTSSGSQTVTIDQQTAIDLGLVTPDVDGNVDCASDAVTQELLADQGKEVSITPPTEEEPVTEEPVNIISSILADFFDVDASLIDGFHEDGFGFGVIAQALWMAKRLDGDISFEQILQAKEDGSGTFTLSDGTEITYTNWGQFKKALSEKHDNLGSAVSGNDHSAQPGNGNGNNSNGNGHQDSNGNGHGNGNGNGNGHGNGNGNGNGHGGGNNNGNGHGNGNGNKP